jgi:hypothetical protein
VKHPPLTLSNDMKLVLLRAKSLKDAARSLNSVANGCTLSQRLYDYLQLHEVWCERGARRMGFSTTAELRRVQTAKAKWEARMKR